MARKKKQAKGGYKVMIGPGGTLGRISPGAPVPENPNQAQMMQCLNQRPAARRQIDHQTAKK
jgi:hypothetical protein